MAQPLSDYHINTPIFVDANIFAYHHSGHPRFGEASTNFLRCVANGELRAVTSNVVQEKVIYFLLMQRGESLLNTRDRSLIHSRIVSIPDFSARCWKAVGQSLNLLDSPQSETLSLCNIDSSHACQIVEMGTQYRLMLRDAAHVVACRLMNLSHIASNDADFDRVGFLARWQP